MTAEEQKEHRALRWDGTITAGNVLTAGALVLGLVVWGLRLEGRVDRADDRQEAYERVSMQYRTEDRQNGDRALTEVRTSLRRIEDYLMRGVTPPGR